MIPVSGENYVFELYKRIDNSYEFEKKPIFFNGRPAGNMEKRTYRILKGVESSNDSIFILSTYLPENLKERDRVKFLGKFWTISSIGYYYKENLLINPSLMSEEYIIKRCPKGIVLQ